MKWKDIIYHKESIFNMKSIMADGLQTVFFSPLETLESENEEEYFHEDMTVARKFHYCSKWKHDQDAVCWVKLVEAQDLGLRF